MKTIIAITATLAILYAIGKDDMKQKEMDRLKAKLEAIERFNDLYYCTLSNTVYKLDPEDRRETVRKFNADVDFIRITNQF